MRGLLADGNLYRLRAPDDQTWAAWQVVAPDASRALVTFVRILAGSNEPIPVLRLRGLDPAARYQIDDGDIVGGDVLMAIGLRPLVRQDFTTRTWHLSRQSGQPS